MAKSLGGERGQGISNRGDRGMLEKGLVNSYLVMDLSQGIRIGGQKYITLLLHSTRTSSSISRDLGVPG